LVVLLLATKQSSFQLISDGIWQNWEETARQVEGKEDFSVEYGLWALHKAYGASGQLFLNCKTQHFAVLHGGKLQVSPV